jgi:hypothetical protein
MTIVLEHRFFGLSSPYSDLNVDSLKFLSIQQAIDDFEHFANNVKLPMPGGDNIKPNVDNSWVLIVGSYSSALITAWTMIK